MAASEARADVCAKGEQVDVADAPSVEGVFIRHPDLTHCIHLAYLMSAEVETDMALGVKVNLLGMVNMFEAAARLPSVMTRVIASPRRTRSLNVSVPSAVFLRRAICDATTRIASRIRLQ